MTEKFAAKAESGLHGCTPSVIACGDATFPKGTAFSGGDKVSGTAKGVPERDDFPRSGGRCHRR